MEQQSETFNEQIDTSVSESSVEVMQQTMIDGSTAKCCDNHYLRSCFNIITCGCCSCDDRGKIMKKEHEPKCCILLDNCCPSKPLFSCDSNCSECNLFTIGEYNNAEPCVWFECCGCYTCYLCHACRCIDLEIGLKCAECKCCRECNCDVEEGSLKYGHLNFCTCNSRQLTCCCFSLCKEEQDGGMLCCHICKCCK